MRRLEHVGVATTDAAAVADVFHALFGRRPYKQEFVDAEHVRTHFIEAGGTKIELLETTEPDSAIGRFLDRHGPGLHHLAFEVDDLDAVHARLSDAGFRVLGPPRPGADGKRIFFVHPRDTAGVLVECCQSVRGVAEARSGAGPDGSPACRVIADPGDGPVVEALSRRLRVWWGDDETPRELPDEHHLVVFGALSAPTRPGGRGRMVWVDPPEARVRSLPDETLIIDRTGGLDPGRGAGLVRIPAPLLDRLPDPDTVLADLIHAHLTA